MLDRKTAPAIHAIERIQLIQANESQLDNSISVGLINAGTQELVRVELLFPGGIWFQQKPLQASLTNAMLEEGTKNRKAIQIADEVDYYGAFLELEIGQDWSSVVLYTLKKHLDKVLPVIEDVVKNPIFQQEELDIMLQNRKQSYQVDIQKVAYLARTRFATLLFGAQNPYANPLELADFDQIKREDLMSFFVKHYSAQNCRIIVAGKVDELVVKLLNKHFGGKDWQHADVPVLEALTMNAAAQTSNGIVIPKFAAPARENFIPKADAVQSGIRIGRALFNKLHADYHPFKVLSTVLGGYFGSRLMNNIREDKGYTYGIGSRVISMQQGGYFFISTEVGVGVCKPALTEIYKELALLRNEKVSAEELELVKTYMIGDFIRSVDGPFALADKYKKIKVYGLGYDYYDRFVDNISGCTAQQLLDLGNKYLQQDDLLELVAGQMQ